MVFFFAEEKALVSVYGDATTGEMAVTRSKHEARRRKGNSFVGVGYYEKNGVGASVDQGDKSLFLRKFHKCSLGTSVYLL
jgi:hypothetical protein